MANEEHLALFKQGVEIWNEWRTKNLGVKVDLSGVNFSTADLNKIDFHEAYLKETNLSGSNLSRANLCGANFNRTNLSRTNLSKTNLNKTNLIGAVLTGSVLREANLCEAALSKANINGADLSRAVLTRAILTEADLTGANLTGANLTRAVLAGAVLAGAVLSGTNLSEAILTGANLSRTQALGTNFTATNFTGACLEDWNTNSYTNLDSVICDYVYLRLGKKERRPSSGNFVPGEFTKLFHKSLETVDLIFRNGIHWDAFAYSFKKVEVENRGAQLDVQSIEKKGDGILVVRVSVSPNADKVKIHANFIQGYEFASKALEAQYQARLEDKDKLIISQEAQINSLIKIVEQRGPFQQTINLQNSQFSGGFVNAKTVQSHQIGGDIYNIDNLENPD